MKALSSARKIALETTKRKILKKSFGQRRCCPTIINPSRFEEGKELVRQLVALVGANWRPYSTNWRHSLTATRGGPKKLSRKSACMTLCYRPPLFYPGGGRFGLSWGWAGDAFNATKRINTFLSCAMQLLVLVLAGLVFGFA